MDPKKAALLAGAAIVALGSGFMAMTLFRGSAAPKVVAAVMPQQNNGPEILIATKPLPVGTIIDPTSFRFQPWPKSLVDSAYYLKGKADISKLTGTVVRSTIAVGQPITTGSLVAPGDRGFLAAALSPGMRALTFPVAGVNGSQGVAGFVFPGDRVDLILTQTFKPSGSGGGNNPLSTTETIIRNLRVLATDQHTNGTVDDKGNRTIVPFTNVTVEATPRIAEKITVAQALGTLSLSLRSIADNQADLERAIATGSLQLPKNDPDGEKKMILDFQSRPVDNQVSFVTGGDVSHFQRKSLPLIDQDGKTVPSVPLRSGGNTPRTAFGVEPVIRRAPVTSSGPTVRVARAGSAEIVELTDTRTSQQKLQDAMSDVVRDAVTSARNRQASPGSGGN
jgi:pilus assembly protein CpaB